MTRWSTEVRSDIGVFAELASWWDNQPAVQDKPFMTTPILSTWIPGVGEPGNELRVFVLTRDSEPVAALPTYRKGVIHRSLYRGQAEPYDVVVSPDEEVLEYVPQWFDSIPLLHLYRVPADSPILEVLPTRSRWVVQQRFRRIYVDLEGGMEAVIAGMSPNRRKSQRRRRRRLEELGSVRFVDHPDPDEIERVLQAGLELEASSWKGQQGDAVLRDPLVHRWYRSLTAALEEAGWLRLSALYLDDRMIAFNYGIVFNGQRFGTVSGYDLSEDVKQLSPWNLLFESILELDASNGVRRYQFGSGGDSYKLEWTSNFDLGFDLRLYGRRTGRALYALDRGRGRVRRDAGAN